MENIAHFFLQTKLGVAIFCLILIFLLLLILLKSGLFRPVRNVLADWSINQASGYHLLNNGARILILFTTITLLFITHIGITINPFHVEPVPLEEWELGLLLTYIGGESFINYLRNKNIPKD